MQTNEQHQIELLVLVIIEIVYKQMSSNYLFKNKVTYKLFAYKSYK